MALSFSALAEKSGKEAPSYSSKAVAVASDSTGQKDTAVATATPTAEPDKDKTVKRSEKLENSNGSETSNVLVIISLAASVVAIVLAVLVFLDAKRKREELDYRCERHNRDLKDDVYNLNGKINKLSSELSKVQGYVDRRIEESRTVLNAPKVPAETPAIPVAPPQEAPKYQPQTFYGVYKYSLNGVRVENLTQNKEDASTFEIVTESEDSAIYHLVGSLSKTQFASLNDSSAVEITEGIPQSYSVITEVAPGKMRLDNNVWKIEEKVKVKLS